MSHRYGCDHKALRNGVLSALKCGRSYDPHPEADSPGYEKKLPTPRNTLQVVRASVGELKPRACHKVSRFSTRGPRRVPPETRCVKRCALRAPRRRPHGVRPRQCGCQLAPRCLAPSALADRLSTTHRACWPIEGGQNPIAGGLHDPTAVARHLTDGEGIMLV
jgi:hypothetical protein